MRRFGTILMILGANLIVWSVVAAYWLAALGCAMGAADGKCSRGAGQTFIDLMSSSDGTIFWVVILAGVLVFWRGKRRRGRASQ